ncbi:ATP-binding cassette domain-containing protein [Saccharothrix coeruleofusca]|uniref:ABC transporter ATP-binding protein n=1 Tax=Saccharothrix coeruleofusca TaxID=33919 RepID=A0A918AGU7_9PSEU|nr:ATP-binding cassette domain-containing protein [Saccharothrix coeruleofusca]GGP34687.1 ABC transporter ATP-binding protein [Saccharothrix coeruleofusca]
MLVHVERVGFSYGRTEILRGVDWRIGLGVTGLLGPNGAGKTTLLNLLVGLARPTGGTITMRDGDRGAGFAVGFVPQRFSLAGEMRVLDTVAYAAWVNGVAREDCGKAAGTALEMVGLSDNARTRVRALSGGQRQRVGIAAALAHQPRLLVLDEPTAGLDPGQRLRLREVVAAIGATRAVLLSTHLIEDISHLCDRVGVLAGGRLVFDGTERELTALIDDTDATAAASAGSRFERAYDALITGLGAARD